MNIQKIKLLKKMIGGLILLIVVTFLAAFAASNSAKDKELLIYVEPLTHCAVKVAPSVNESICALLYSAKKNPCKNDPECVCSKNEKYIVWKTTTGDAFNINFTKGSPFKKCEYRADRDSEVRCKIKNSGDYYYEVNVKGCATNPYDPRIVVQ